MTEDRSTAVERANEHLRGFRYEAALDTLLALLKTRLAKLREGAQLDALDLRVIILVADLHVQLGQSSSAEEYYDTAERCIEDSSGTTAATLLNLVRAKRVLAAVQSGEHQRALWRFSEIGGGFAKAIVAARAVADLAEWERTCEWTRVRSGDAESVAAALIVAYLAGARVMISSLRLLQARCALLRGAELVSSSEPLAVRYALDLAQLELLGGDVAAAAARLRGSPQELGAADLPSRTRWFVLDARLARLTGQLGRCKTRLEAGRALALEHGRVDAFIQAEINLAEFQLSLNQSVDAKRRLLAMRERLGTLAARHARSIEAILAVAERGGARDTSFNEMAVSSIYRLGGGAESFAADAEAPEAAAATPFDAADLELRFNRALFEFRIEIDRRNLRAARAALAQISTTFRAVDSRILQARTEFAHALLSLAERRISEAAEELQRALERFGDIVNLETWQCLNLLATCNLFLGNWGGATAIIARADEQLSKLTLSLPREDRSLFVLDKSSAEDRYIGHEVFRIQQLTSELETSSIWKRLGVWLRTVRRVRELVTFIERFDERRYDAGSGDDTKPRLRSVWWWLFSVPRDRVALRVVTSPDRTLCVVRRRGAVAWFVGNVGRGELRADVRSWHAHASQLQQRLGDGTQVPDDEVQAGVAVLGSIANSVASKLGIVDLLEPTPPAARRLVFYPDDVLHIFPLAAVPVGKVYLAERFAISHGYRSPTGPPVVPRAGAAAVIGLAGAVQPGPGVPSLPALPDVLPECDDVSRLLEARLGAAPYTLLVDDSSTRSNMKPRIIELLQMAKVAHVACHGYFDAYNVLRSGLLLPGDDGQATLLTLGEIARLNLANLESLTLSACFSADAVTLPGRWTLGLPQAFCMAGVREVLGSMWPVHDALGRVFVRSLYEAAATMPIAEALQHAQIRFIRGAIEFPRYGLASHPYYWASFCLHSREANEFVGRRP